MAESINISDTGDLKNQFWTNTEFLQNIFKYSGFGAAILNHKGEFIKVNDAFCNIIGYSEEELTKLTFHKITHPDDLNIGIALVDEIHKGKRKNFQVEKRYIHKNGNPIWCSINVTAIQNIDKKSYLTIAQIHDITDLEKTKKSLIEEQSLLKSIVDNLPIGLYIKDYEGRKVLVNPIDAQNIGEEESKIIGKTDFDFFSKEIAEQTYKDDINVIKTGQPIINKEEFIIDHKGESKWLITSKIPWKNWEGKVIGLIGLGLDITTRKKAEQELIKAKEKAEESDKLKTTFLANMSHEIRTPMNAIIGFSDLMVRSGQSEERRSRFSKLIKERSLDLLRIIEDILDISKIEIGQMSLYEENTNIEILLKNIDEYYSLKKESIKNNNTVKFSLKYGEEVKNLQVLLDEQRVKQILINFIDNALKFTKEGNVILSCEIKDEKELIFCVSDTGIGIISEKQSIIFDRFRQAEDSMTTRSFGGTGLGLSIAKGLSDLIGGKIWLESTINLGSKFYFSMPIIKNNIS